MSLGKTLRMKRIFDARSGTALIVPMDHGIEGYFKELEDPRGLIRSIVDAGANALLLRRGLAEFAAAEYAGKAGLIYRITSASGLGRFTTEQPFISTVEEAVRIGADAVVANLFVGSEREAELLQRFGAIAEACDMWGMPFCAEMMPIGKKGSVPFDGPYSPDEVRIAVRVGAEEGADFIKTYYTGDVDSFREVVRYSTVPLIIAGGPPVKTDAEVLQMVRDAMDAGASGIAMGRKIWGARDPPALTRALGRIIREKATVAEALEELKR
ncbi:MAG: 2-amino-3,7-dideoxy-D-threo-hept-6-ulosonate synthase [Candidatus Bathyarchaeia archaeon]